VDHAIELISNAKPISKEKKRTWTSKGSFGKSR
jgi:hypothetical protein